MKSTALTIIAALALSPMPALAQHGATHANNAAILKSPTSSHPCEGFVPTAEGGKGAPIFEYEAGRKVINAGGVTSVVCHFDVPEELRPDRIRRAVDFPCLTNDEGEVRDSMMMVNAAGKGLLVCRVRNTQRG